MQINVRVPEPVLGAGVPECVGEPVAPTPLAQDSVAKEVLVSGFTAEVALYWPKRCTLRNSLRSRGG